MKLTDKNIELFLDGVDTVLNSNTFLLKAIVKFSNIEETTKDISNFAHSGSLKSEIIRQDLSRDWCNYQRLNYKGEPVPFDGEFVKPHTSIKLNELSNEDALKHLRTMLTIESNAYNFWSPYNKQFDKAKAISLVSNFIGELTLAQKWKLYTLNTDFLYSQLEIKSKNGTMAYFEGDYGSDSATLIVREDNHAFLLLTNGID